MDQRALDSTETTVRKQEPGRRAGRQIGAGDLDAEGPACVEAYRNEEGASRLQKENNS